ncbi:hypothetical protein GF359_09920 [candidate division WOR-3 bacterium]|uniref:Peptidase C45 n=1 Tax=candidate division WOR-3 bacterium TaxID=2052148 RepID=A0A9D5QDX8_UNCW3|nr:hypothetical protein [candidate division WOR-3 bacterium]MBD3365517.1 hypothetical protein [candidate division WOR-3 bacterium]
MNTFPGHIVKGMVLVFVTGFGCIFCHREKPSEVKGRLETRSGQTILTVWGSHYDMGYAQGYLLGNDFLELFDEYFLDDICYSEDYEIKTRPHVIENCIDPNLTPYGEELQGLYDGWRQVSEDSGWSTVSTVLGRSLDIIDLYAVQFIPDLAFEFYSSQMCSSISAWGGATESDPDAAGGVIYCRILDWDPDDALIENSVIVVYNPEGEIGWVSFGYPFFIGCLTGVSQDGVCASYNLEQRHHETAEEAEKFWPVLWSIRRGLESDCNSDGSHTADDIYTEISAHRHKGAHIIHCAQPYLQKQDKPAFVIETNSTGRTLRYSDDEPDIAPHHLIATNHFRSLYAPSNCSRYSELLAELTNDPEVTTERAWALEDSVMTPWSVMKVLIRPDNLDFWLAWGDEIAQSLDNAVYYELDALLDTSSTSLDKGEYYD